jgi:hypothetical protein
MDLRGPGVRTTTASTWCLIKEAKAAGLKVNTAMVNYLVLGEPERTYQAPDAQGDLHNSLKGFWWILEIIPKLARLPAITALYDCWILARSGAPVTAIERAVLGQPRGIKRFVGPLNRGCRASDAIVQFSLTGRVPNNQLTSAEDPLGGLGSHGASPALSGSAVCLSVVSSPGCLGRRCPTISPIRPHAPSNTTMAGLIRVRAPSRPFQP